MSSSRNRATDLVGIYDHVLEQQIVERGCSLVCRDAQLCKEMEELLMDRDAQETHCLGLDPLRVMEESLKVAAESTPAAAYGQRVKARGGLRGLAKAFEVLEQAALNLYLGPWREEYRVIKMYSGTFTHYITPVLSVSQIDKLFGLLGYQPSPPRLEQLCLQSPKVSSACLSDLLRLSCAFFVARCECHLLLSALGKHVGDAQWELSMVRERQRGNSPQVALDNTKKNLEVNQPLVESADEVDLYSDEQANGPHTQVVVSDDENPLSLINEVSYTPTPLEFDTSKSFPASKSKSKKSKYDKLDSKQIEVSGQGKGDANHPCSCLHSSAVLRHSSKCNTLDDITCAYVDICKSKGHQVQFTDDLPEKMNNECEMSPPSGVFSSTSSSLAMSSSAVCDEDTKSASSSLHPIRYHDCCNPAKPDPRVLCHTCYVFHSGSCMEGNVCQKNHNVSRLGTCSCGKFCSRKPLVLCRYCGKEYCSACWYRTPVTCTCGKTFDQSSSV